MSVYFFCQREARSHVPVCSKNATGFLIGKKYAHLHFGQCLPHLFAESSNTTGLTGKEKFSRHKTNWWAKILLLFWSTRFWPPLSLKWASPHIDFSLKYFLALFKQVITLLMRAPEAHLDLLSNGLESPFLLAWASGKDTRGQSIRAELWIALCCSAWCYMCSIIMFVQCCSTAKYSAINLVKVHALYVLGEGKNWWEESWGMEREGWSL